jgi:hypothetical protein
MLGGANKAFMLIVVMLSANSEDSVFISLYYFYDQKIVMILCTLFIINLYIVNDMSNFYLKCLNWSFKGVP